MSMIEPRPAEKRGCWAANWERDAVLLPDCAALPPLAGFAGEPPNKYPPAKPGVFPMRAKPYVTSARVSSRKYGLPAARVLLPATRKRV